MIKYYLAQSTDKKTNEVIFTLKREKEKTRKTFINFNDAIDFLLDVNNHDKSTTLSDYLVMLHQGGKFTGKFELKDAQIISEHKEKLASVEKEKVFDYLYEQKLAQKTEDKASDKKEETTTISETKKANKVAVVKDKKAATKPQFATQVSSEFITDKIYEQAIFDTILSERASRRQGTHQVKNRAEVSGSGKKPWKQKGTGRARTSSLRTPIFVGGGRAFGPQAEKNYSLKVNKKVKLAAWKSAFTLLVNDKAILVQDMPDQTISTKTLNNELVKLQVSHLKRVVIVTENENVYKSAANLPYVSTIKANSLTVETLIGADVLIVSKESMTLLEGKVK